MNMDGLHAMGTMDGWHTMGTIDGRHTVCVPTVAIANSIATLTIELLSAM
jgi:hypothetical protein